MYQYINGFTCAVGSDKNTIMLSFRQKAPFFDNDGKLVDTEMIQVASVVMDKKLAEELGKTLASAANHFEGNEDARLSVIPDKN